VIWIGANFHFHPYKSCTSNPLFTAGSQEFVKNNQKGELMSLQSKKFDAVIIGGGQAGLAMSYLLTQQDREHIILEKSQQIGESWRQRWDSFTLVTPNWQLQLPGYPYEGDNPDGFLTRDEIVTYLETYADRFDPPLRFGVEVTAVTQNDSGSYQIHTPNHIYEADNVVVAVGTFQQPHIPPFSSKAPEDITQLHSSDYRNPEALPAGNVLVVGSGQSGCQIAQELNENGRQVYLCTSQVGRLPRRYRGKDGMWWADKLGIFDETIDDLDSPAERFAPNPQVSGKNGGQEIDLHQFARDGIHLLGHLEDIRGHQLILAPNLHQNIAAADKQVEMFCQGVDKYVRAAELDVPQETMTVLQDGYQQEEITELNLKEANIHTIIWATGFDWDFSWIKLPILDEYAYPVQQQGITDYPGLYFLGLHWLHTRKSGLLFGVGEDAEHIAQDIAVSTLEQAVA
jgi:putative flavoprotein involved in K+ transport